MGPVSFVVFVPYSNNNMFCVVVAMDMSTKFCSQCGKQLPDSVLNEEEQKEWVQTLQSISNPSLTKPGIPRGTPDSLYNEAEEEDDEEQQTLQQETDAEGAARDGDTELGQDSQQKKGGVREDSDELQDSDDSPSNQSTPNEESKPRNPGALANNGTLYQKCPTCTATIAKQSGSRPACDAILCNCGAHFCFYCGASNSDPYDMKIPPHGPHYQRRPLSWGRANFYTCVASGWCKCRTGTRPYDPSPRAPVGPSQGDSLSTQLAPGDGDTGDAIDKSKASRLEREISGSGQSP